MMRPMFSSIALVVLSACASTPQEIPVSTTVAPDRFVAQDVLHKLSTVENAGVAGVRWWEGFNDPILNGLIESSLENNFEIASAAARVKEARALMALSETGDSLLLELDAELNAQKTDRNNAPASSGNTSSNNNRRERSALIGLGFTQPVDLAGRVDNEVRAAAAALMAEQAGLRAQIISTSTAVAQEYLRLRGNQKQLVTLRELVALQEKTLDIVQARFDSGLSPELDVLRAETSVETLRADIAPLEQSLQDSRHRLATLGGKFAGAYDELLTPTGQLPVYSLAVPARVPLQVIQARPDVQAAQARFAQASAEVGFAQADFYPAIELMGSIQIGSSAINSNPASSILIASLAALLNQVIYDGGARNARLNAAQARLEGALANYEQALRVVAQEVESALNAIDASTTRQLALNRAVGSSKRSMEQAEALYQSGLVGFLDVVDAQRVYANALQSMELEQANRATLLVDLFRVLGVQS